MKRLVWRLAIVLFFLGTAQYPGVAAPELEQLIDEVNRQREEQHIPGLAIVVIKGDQVLISQGLGLRDLDAKLPVTEETLFAIGSATKSFTAVLTGMLIDEKKLTWDDPVQRYLPELKFRAPGVTEKITLRDLLSHRSGLTRTPLLWASGKASRGRMLRQVVEAEPLSELGQEFHYNNVTYAAAGYAATKAAGAKNWDQLLASRIFGPLGMTQSSTDIAVLRGESASRGYYWDDSSKSFETLTPRDLSLIAPSGAINSNIRDMTRWLRFLLAGGKAGERQLIFTQRLEEMWEPQIDIAAGVLGYGMGWMVRDWQGRRVAQHGGNIDGYCSAVAVMPEEGIGVVMLANVTAAPLQASVLDLVFSAVLGEPVPGTSGKAHTPGKPLTADELQPYVGRYKLDLLQTEATVQVVDDRLAIDIPGQTVYKLRWPDERGRWVFEITDTIELEFDDPVDDEVPAATLYQVAQLTLPREDAPLALGKSPDAGQPWTAEQLAPLLGRFKFTPNGDTWTTQIAEDRLAVDVPGQGVWPLIWPDEDGRWKLEIDPNQSLKFVSDDVGTIRSIDFRNNIIAPMPRLKAAANLDVSLEELIALARPDGAATHDGPVELSGKIEFVNQGVPATQAVIFDNERLMIEVDAKPFGRITTLLDGDRGWLDSDFEPARAPRGTELAQLRLSHPLRAFGDWRDGYESVELIAEEELDGKKVYVASCVPADGPATKKYIDAKTGLVVMERSAMADRTLGSVPVTTRYSDYRAVAGLMIPFRIEQNNDFTGTSITIIESARTEGVKIPRKAFAPLAAP